MTYNPQLSFCVLPSKSPIRVIYIFPGGIAQLVERQLCKLDVRGSNPLASKRGLAGETKSCLGKIATAINPLASNEKYSVYSFQYWFS